MKKMISILLTATIIFMSFPLTIFAENFDNVMNEIMPNTEVAEEYTKLSELPPNYGQEALNGNDIYYIEEGVLLHSFNNARPNHIDDNVTWVIEENGYIYYSKLDGYNTFIYKIGEDDIFCKILCPIDCFDIENELVYYLYNEDVFKYDTKENSESCIFHSEGAKLFFIKNQEFVFFTSSELETYNSEPLTFSLDHTAYRQAVEKINKANPALQAQIHRHNVSGLCNVSTITMLLNRMAKHKGVSNTSFSIFDVFNGNGVTNVKLYGKTSYGYNSYTYSGDTDYWASKSYTDSNKKISCQSKVEQYGSVSAERMATILNNHPEGVAIRVYYGNRYGHCIVLTDYDYVNGKLQFYAIDPVDVASGKGRIKLEDTWMYKQQKNIFSNLNFIAVINKTTVYNTCNNCAKMGTKSFAYTGDGCCSSCKTQYNWKSTRTTSSSEVTLGIWKRKSNTTYKKLYLRTTPYDNNNLIVSDKFDSIEVLALVRNADGGRWYEVSVNGKNGYIVAYKVDADYTFQSQYGPSQINISPSKYPTGTIQPKAFSLAANITSKYKISSVLGEIIDSSNNKVVCSATASNVNSTSYSIAGKAVDNGLKFGTLKSGKSYYLKYTVWDVTNNGTDKGNGATWKSAVFNVQSAVSTPATPVCTTPTIAISNIEDGQRATITCSDSSALIHAKSSTNGEKTGYGSVVIDFTTPGACILDAWTTRSGYIQSGIITRTISVNKVSAPQIGDAVYNAKENNVFVTISASDSSTVYYTKDGSKPTKNSQQYTGPIYVTDTTTIKAINAKYGSVNSEIIEKKIVVEDPETPTVLLKNTKDKVAQGKTATVEWNQTARAIEYEATLYYNGEVVESYNTSGTTASFVLNSTGQYEIGVKAIGISLPSLKGYSDEDFVSVESMAPVTITFIDKIDRSRQVTDDVLAEVQQRINEHDGENAELIEGNIISVQTIDYDTKPAKPVTPSKKGFTFSGWSGELFETATENKTVYANFEINYYTVDFFDTAFDTPQQLGHTQEVMYTDSAVEPTDYSTPEGYYLSGWSVDNTKSSGFDYTYVDGNILLNTVYNWENTELPVYVEITELERNDESYKVSINYKNNPVEETRGRMVVALYTSEGRNVYTQISETDLKIGEMTEWTDYGAVTLLYTGKIAYAKAFVVAVDGDNTGGALSEAAFYDNITYEDDSNFWTEWSDWQDEPVESSDNVQVTTRTVYRYQDKTEATSTTTKNLGSEWTYYNTTSWNTGWKSNGTSSISAFENESQKREVSSSWVPATYKTQYRYGRWTNGSKVHFCPQLGRSNYGGSWYQQHSSWSDSASTMLTDKAAWYCNSTLGHSHINPYTNKNNVDYWYYYRVNNNTYYWQETKSVQTGGGYTTYSYRDTYYTHYFYKWGDWSEWSDAEVTSTGTRNVEEKTQYQYRTVSDVDMESEAPTLYTYQKTLELNNVQTDLSGELATVMIYKKTNTDPTQEQIEYIDQITIGEGNTIEINANTKEMLDYNKTGDFIVALALEGGKELINVDYIEAPAPVYTVNFYVDGQLFKTVQVEEEKSVDVNEVGIPEVDGKVFSKWDKSVVDINRNLDVNAVFEQETYQIVFVDHENKTVQTEEFSYGDALIVPAVAMIDGKTFKGWDKVVDNEEYIVEKSDVITAKWENLSYQVKFRNFDGEIVSEQTIEYGNAAKLPNPIAQDDITYQWDLTGYEWWKVTQDMDVYPYVPQKHNVVAPIINVSTEDVGGMFYAELETSEDEGTIYYTYYEGITDEDIKDFAEHLDLDTENSEMEEVILLSESLEEPTDDGINNSEVAYEFEDMTGSIEKYTGPIEINPGTIVHAFTVDAEGNTSSIAVFNFDYDSTEHEETETIELDSNCPVITLPTITAFPGETISVPIMIKNNPGVTELSLIVGYDANNLELMDTENGDVFTESEYSNDIRNDGSCKFIWESDEVNTKAGTLVTLIFAVGETSDQYDITLSVDEVAAPQEEEQPFSVINGTIDTAQNLLGDVNGDGEIDFADGILILKHDVGLTNLSSEKLTAGDVNGDGEVDFSDAILVLKFDVGLITSFKQ